MQTESERYVLLRAGLAVPVAPVLLLLELESRGLSITRDEDEIVIRPSGQLTDADLAALRRWKPHVLALLDYEATEVA